jgi:hemin uptake protein HemP
MAQPRAPDEALPAVPAPASGAGVLPSASMPAAPSRRWRSAELFGAGQEVEIEHGQAVYRLRLTSLGKLILTK